MSQLMFGSIIGHLVVGRRITKQEIKVTPIIVKVSHDNTLATIKKMTTIMVKVGPWMSTCSR